MRVTIRKAVSDDAATLSALGCAAYPVYFGDIWGPRELEEFLTRDFSTDVLSDHLDKPESYAYLLCEADGEAVGFARINWRRPVPGLAASGAELQKIYFLPGHTGKGLGTSLMDAVINLVAGQGENIVWLDVLSTNPRARSLYERLGFEVVGRKPFKTEVVDIELIVMLRRLESRSAQG